MRMGARHQKIKKESPSLLDKDLLMEDTEARRREHRDSVNSTLRIGVLNSQNDFLREKFIDSNFALRLFSPTRTSCVFLSAEEAEINTQDLRALFFLLCASVSLW